MTDSENPFESKEKYVSPQGKKNPVTFISIIIMCMVVVIFIIWAIFTFATTPNGFVGV